MFAPHQSLLKQGDKNEELSEDLREWISPLAASISRHMDGIYRGIGIYRR